MTTEDLLQLSQITHGRIAPREVFQDFVALCALSICAATDPVQGAQQGAELERIQNTYTPAERSALRGCFLSLLQAIQQDLVQARFHDWFGEAFQALGLGGRGSGIDFTPSGLASLMAAISLGSQPVLPESGYFTITDPTCGSGVLLLAAANQLTQSGFNPCQHLAVQAVDRNRTCAYMAYVQLSLYGIPAVVIHGDTLTMQEFARWYTPAYLWAKWVWRCPLAFVAKRSKADELLKMYSDPMYATLRQAQVPELGSARHHDSI